MTPLIALARGIDSVNEWIGRKVIWLIFASILISAGNAVVRKLFDMSSNAWLEAQWYLFGAAFMLGAAYTLKENEHIRIDIVYGRWSRRTRHYIDLFGHVVFLLPFAVLMAWMLWPYMMDSIRSGQVSTNASGLIIWPARMILFVGFALLVAQGISEVIKKIAILKGRIEDPHPFEAVQKTTLAHVQEIIAGPASAAPQEGKK